MSRRRQLAILAALGFGTMYGPMARAQLPATIRIGVLNDMSGPYADVSGKGSVIAAQMASEDFAKEAGPSAPKVEILAGDHQNKADIGANIARGWVDRDNVLAVVDVPNSAVALAVNQIMREKDRAFLASSTATSDLTGPQCAPTTVQWTFDTWALANGTARAVFQAGGHQWFFIGSDYTRWEHPSFATRAPSSRPRAGLWWATCERRSARQTSRRTCCKRSPPAQT